MNTSLHLLAAGVALGLAVAAPAHAKTGLNDSGMVQCLNATGQLVSACQGTDQDGEFGRDVSSPAKKDGRLGFSFVKVCNSGELAGKGACSKSAALGPGANDWGCTRDKITGLTWELKTDDGGDRDADLVYTQTPQHQPGDASEFVALVNGRGLCGASDWRLPTALELQSLADHGSPGINGMAIDTQWFPNQRPFPYWSGEVFSYISDYGWLVDLGSATVSFQGRTSPWPVMLVRGAGLGGGKRYVANGPEVTDTLTGMVWQRCPLGQSWSGTACTGAATWLDWPSAMAAAKSAATNSGLPWRLPNLKELNSLVDRTQYAPSMDRVAFPWPQSLGLWSSTPASDVAGEVWVSDTLYGNAYHFDRGYGFNAALLVRPLR